MPQSPQATLAFDQATLDLLAKTADALSAYLGKPVLAEVDTGEDGAQWVTFGMVLDAKQATDAPVTHVQLGGAQARLLGGRGGLSDTETYDCQHLWSIQIVGTDGERYVKLDAAGDLVAASDIIEDLLPFGFSDEATAPIEDDLEADDDEDDDDLDDALNAAVPPSPWRH